MLRKKMSFDEWNESYDIPDDPRPVDETRIYNDADEIQDDILHKEEMKHHINKLRNRAMRIRTRQNYYWNHFGDNYKLEELAEFIYDNREYIVGVVRDARWLATVNWEKWEDDFDSYYNTLLNFIERSRYAITSYDTQIKKLNEKLKGLRDANTDI